VGEAEAQRFFIRHSAVAPATEEIPKVSAIGDPVEVHVSGASRGLPPIRQQQAEIGAVDSAVPVNVTDATPEAGDDRPVDTRQIPTRLAAEWIGGAD